MKDMVGEGYNGAEVALERIAGSWVPSDPTYSIGLQGCTGESILMLPELFVKASPLTV